MKDFYYILGTNANSTFTEVKEAYQKLYEKFHPDLNQNDQYFENQFREIYEAYQILSDPEKRRRYDEELKKTKANSTFNATNKVAYSSKTKAIDITFTVIFGIATLVFASYVIQSLTGSKKAKIKKAPVVAAAVSFHKIKRHKKKHPLQFKTTSNIAKVKPDTIKTPAVSSAPVIVPHLVSNSDKKPVNSPKTEIKSISAVDIEKNTTTDGPNILYTTYIKANETGVINMRKFDNYSSEILKVIPGNSKVSVLEKGNTYYKVTFENATGYVPRWTLQIK